MYICVMQRQAEYNLSSISKFGELEASRLSHISNPEYKAQSIAGLLALDKALGNIEDKPRSFEIERKEGRPFFAEPCGLDFNISHSAALVCCVLSDSAVGIDIERISRNAEKNERIAEHFFTENEKALLSSCEGEKDELFYKIWTAKEATAKRSSGGLACTLSEDTVQNARDGKAFFRSFILRVNGEKYIMTVCSDKETGIREMLIYDGIDCMEY